jgi:hypothetical protein
MRIPILACLTVGVLGCGGNKDPQVPSSWANFECKDRSAAYDVVGGMQGQEAGVTLDCKNGPQVVRWVEDKDGTRTEDSAALTPGEFNDVWIRIDGIGWHHLGDCAGDLGADVPVYRFDIADWNGTATFQCDSMDPPFPYNTVVDELNQLAATIRGDRGRNSLDIDDSDLE